MTPDPRRCPLCGGKLIRDPVAWVLICPECKLDFESAVAIKAKQEHNDEIEQGTETTANDG